MSEPAWSGTPKWAKPGFTQKSGLKRSVSWSDVLRDGEKILWKGRPFPGVRVTNFKIIASVIFIIFIWGILSLQNNPGNQELDPTRRLVLCSLLVAWILIVWLHDFVRLLVTHYAFTQQRCLILTGLLKRELHSYSIEFAQLKVPEIRFIADVYFAEEIVEADDGKEYRLIGFENIRNADVVYRDLKKLKRAAI